MTRSVLGIEQTVVSFTPPANACDCHAQLFGPVDTYPFAAGYPYNPGLADTPDLLALLAALGLCRVVLVQPTAYGLDNARLVAGLRQLGHRARGVAVIDEACPDEALTALHQAGVRGARVDLIEGRSDPLAEFEGLARIARRVAGLGWHIETDAGLAEVSALHDEIRALPVPLVIKHFAGALPEQGVEQKGFDTLQSLLRDGQVYVKLSAPRRVTRTLDAANLRDLTRALIWANPDRILWGSDWPHQAVRRAARRQAGAEQIEVFEPQDDGLALNRLRGWAAERTFMHRILVRNPARLYRFPSARR